MKPPVTEVPILNADNVSASDIHKEPVQLMYTVKSGDSLSKIAQQHYGDGTQWKKYWKQIKISSQIQI